MRLRDILLYPAELWRMGLEQLRRCLGHDSESRRLMAEQQATIAQLRDRLHLSDLRVEFLESEMAKQSDELKIHKNATANMWKFIHKRHRLDMPVQKGSIRDVLKRLERQ